MAQAIPGVNKSVNRLSLSYYSLTVQIIIINLLTAIISLVFLIFFNYFLLTNNNNIEIKMTLTTPNCPVADSMPQKVGESLVNIKGISSIKVELVWEPKWSKDMMSDDAKLALDI